MIGPSAGRPVYKQPAGILRQRIESGSHIDGEMLSSAAAMARTLCRRAGHGTPGPETGDSTEIRPADRAIIEISAG